MEICSGASCGNSHHRYAHGTSLTTRTDGVTSNRYRVLAKDAAGNQVPYSSIVTPTPNDGQAPTAPTNLVPMVISIPRSIELDASTDNVGSPVIKWKAVRRAAVTCRHLVRQRRHPSTIRIDRVKRPIVIECSPRMPRVMQRVFQYSVSATTVDGQHRPRRQAWCGVISSTQINLSWTA